jgi:plastocyanin
MCAPISCICSTYDDDVRMRAAAAAGLLLALTVLVAPGHGVTRDVSLTADGPKPRSLTLKPGDRVQFVNNDSVPHQVASRSGWQYNSGPLPPGRITQESPPLTAPGTYTYDDIRGLFFAFEGRLVVPKPAPSPSPTLSPRPSPTRASPVPSATSSPTPSPTPVTPTPSATRPSAVPVPTAAPTRPAPRPAPEVRYGVQQALVQSSPHRYGLPTLIALVCVVGVLSLLLRYLLFLAPAGAERSRW